MDKIMQIRASMGQKLRKYRKKMGYSSKKVAEIIGISGGYVRSIELNKIKNSPNREILRKLAELYGIDENEVYRAYNYSEVSRVTPELPKTPQRVIVDLEQMANSFIPVYKWEDKMKAEDYISYGWQKAPEAGEKCYIINEIKCTDNVSAENLLNIVKGYIVIVKESENKTNRLSLYEDRDGRAIISDIESNGSRYLGIIKQICLIF